MHNKPDAHIHIRAYYIWEAEGRPHGRHEAHWHQAEKEIYAEQHVLKTAAPKKAEDAKAPAKKPSIFKKAVAKKASAKKPAAKKAKK